MGRRAERSTRTRCGAGFFSVCTAFFVAFPSGSCGGGRCASCSVLGLWARWVHVVLPPRAGEISDGERKGSENERNGRVWARFGGRFGAWLFSRQIAWWKCPAAVLWLGALGEPERPAQLKNGRAQLRTHQDLDLALWPVAGARTATLPDKIKVSVPQINQWVYDLDTQEHSSCASCWNSGRNVACVPLYIFLLTVWRSRPPSNGFRKIFCEPSLPVPGDQVCVRLLIEKMPRAGRRCLFRAAGNLCVHVSRDPEYLLGNF